MRTWILERISMLNPKLKKNWCCSHCNEDFYTYGEARIHVLTCPANPINKLHAEVLQGLDKEVKA